MGELRDDAHVLRRLDEPDEFRDRFLLHRVLREADPDPSAGAGGDDSRLALRNGRDVPERKLLLAQAWLEVAQLPASAQEHRGVPRDGRRGELLVIVVGEDRARGGPLGDGVVHELEDADHLFAIGRKAEDGFTLVVDELATLPPEHRKVIEDRALPSSRVEDVAGDLLLARDPARDRDQFIPGPGRSGHQILAVVENAAVGAVPHAVDVACGVRESVDGEGEEVVAVLLRPVRVKGLDVLPRHEQRHPEAVDRGEIGKPVVRGRHHQLGLVQFECGHDGNVDADVGMGQGPVAEDAVELLGHVLTGGEV